MINQPLNRWDMMLCKQNGMANSSNVTTKVRPRKKINYYLHTFFNILNKLWKPVLLDSNYSSLCFPDHSVQHLNDSSALNNEEDNMPVDCQTTCRINCQHGLKRVGTCHCLGFCVGKQCWNRYALWTLGYCNKLHCVFEIVKHTTHQCKHRCSIIEWEKLYQQRTFNLHQYIQ